MASKTNIVASPFAKTGRIEIFVIVNYSGDPNT